MKRYFLYIFLFIFIAGFLIWPLNGLGNDEKEIQLSNKEANFLLNIVQKKLYQRAKVSFSDEGFELEDGAAMTVIHKAAKSKMFSYFFQDVPKEITKNLIKATFKVIKLLFAQDFPSALKQILEEFEKLTVEKAKEYLMNFLLQNEIKVHKGELTFSYISFKGNIQKAFFQHIITFRSLDKEIGQVAMEFYSLKTIEPPGLAPDTPCDLREDLKPFILRVRGNLGQESGGYYWIGEPEIEVVFDELVPDLGFEEPGFFDKLKNRLNEIGTAFEKAVEMISIIFGKFNLFQAALNPVMPEEPVPEIDVSEINLENLLPIAEKIKEVEEKLTIRAEEVGDRTSELNLEEIQKILDEISEKIDIITQNILKLAQEQGIDLEDGFLQQEGLGQIVFSSTLQKTKNQEFEQEQEEQQQEEGEELAGVLEDTTPPEVIFELESVQTSLSFTLFWTATDPMDSVTPTGIDGFYLQYQIPGLETTSPSDEEGIVLWYQGEDEDWQDWPVGEILELGPDKENLPVLGKDEYIYNFRLQARDKAGNLSQWQETSTTIIIPEETPPLNEAAWPMYQHDAQHTGRSPFTGPAISSEPELATLIEGEELGPAVIGSDSTIYLKTEEGLSAFDYDASPKWVYELNSIFGTPGLWEPNKVIYIFSQDEGISAIDIRDGSLKWKKEYNILLNQNPVIGDNGKIYFITEDSGLIVLNKNGEQEWIYDFGPISGPVSNLAVDQEENVYFGQGDTLFAVNSQGEKWRRIFEEKCNYYYCAPEVHEISIADDGTIYVLVAWESDFVSMTDADTLSCIHALNPEDPVEEQEKWPTICWRFSLIPVPISYQGNIYLSVSWLDFSSILRTRVAGYDSQGNSIVNWQPPIWGGIGRVSSIILDEEENVYALFSYYDNTIKALNSNGEEKWSLTLERGTGQISPLILGGDGDLFISTQKKFFVIK